MEIDTYTLFAKEPLLLKFNSDEYGIFGSKIELPENVVTTHGISLKNTGPAKFKSVRSGFDHWYSFRANSIGHLANMTELDEYVIAQWVEKNPDLVCRNWDDILLHDLNRCDFKRARRPFVAFSDIDTCVGILWEVYPALKRLGVYIGRDVRGKGGYVRFYDFDEFKVL